MHDIPCRARGGMQQAEGKEGQPSGPGTSNKYLVI